MPINLSRKYSREETAKAAQGYDPDAPRCGTCIYFTLGSHKRRREEARKGRGIDHLQRCTFGNFRTSTKGLCDEWRTKDGERLEVPG